MVMMSTHNNVKAARTLVLNKEQPNKEQVIKQLQEYDPEAEEVNENSLLTAFKEKQSGKTYKNVKENPKNEIETIKEPSTMPSINKPSTTQMYTIEGEFGTFVAKYLDKYESHTHFCIMYSTEDPMFIPKKGVEFNLSFSKGLDKIYVAKTTGISFIDSSSDIGMLIIEKRIKQDPIVYTPLEDTKQDLDKVVPEATEEEKQKVEEEIIKEVELINQQG